MNTTAKPTIRRSWFGLTTAVLCLVSFVGARAALEVLEHGSGLAVAVALVPVFPFAVLIWLIVRGIGEADELERRINFEALAVAFPLTILMLMLLGLLELAMELNPADWSYRHIWPFTVMFWLVGLAIARRRYA